MISQQLLAGIGVVASVPAPPTPFKVFNNVDIEELYETFAEAKAYIDDYVWTGNLFLEITSNDTIVLESTWVIDYDRNGFALVMYGTEGYRPRLSGGGVLESIVDITQNQVTFANVDFIDCDKENTGGCNIRLRSPCSLFVLQFSTISDGYCGIRGTGDQTGDGIAITILENFYCSDITFSRMKEGSVRLGNGVTSDPSDYNTNWSTRPVDWYDMSNIVFNNITLEDVDDLGTGGGFSTNLLLLFKKINGLTVTNVTCNGTRAGVMSIESSYNVLVNRVYCDAFGFNGLSNQSGLLFNAVDKVYIKNTFVKPMADAVGKKIIYCNDSREIYFQFNTCIAVNSSDACCVTYHCKTHNLFGNLLMNLNTQALDIFITNKHGNVGSMADITGDDYNMYVSNSEYNVNAQIASADNIVDVQLRNNTGGGKYNIASYFSTFGLGEHSLLPTGSVVTYVDNLLTSDSTGYKRVVGAGDVESLDLFGATRTDPCNTGAVDNT